MQKFQCPECGDQKRLRGKRTGPKPEDSVDIECLACGHKWSHDPLSCPACGGPMVAERRPLLMKARGTQQSIIGFNTVKICPACDPAPEEKPPGWMSASE